MRNGIKLGVAVAVLALLGSALFAQQPAPQPVWTRITLTKLHCNGCLKRIATELETVPGVAGVQGHLPTASVYVQHKQGVNPSPRIMWEAVQSTEHTPVKLEGPTGTFTQKPQS